MICPACGKYTKVTFTKNFSNWIRRRRHCYSCGYKFNTGEVNGALLHDLRSIVVNAVHDKGKPLLSYKDISKLIELIEQLPDIYVENDSRVD